MFDKSYINGNYFVSVDYNGTKLKQVLRRGESFKPLFPDSIDLKITNSCSWGCKFCHESSHSGGKSLGMKKTIDLLSKLPKVPIEIAIGGGNVFDIPNQTYKLVKTLNRMSFLTRITVSRKDLFTHLKDKRGLCYKIFKSVGAIGISMDRYFPNPFGCRDSFDFITEFNGTPKFKGKSVFHVIIGVLPIEDFKKMLKDKKDYNRILVLGFKQFGRAAKMKVEHLDEWKEVIRGLIKEQNNYKTVGFDNLALEQLGLDEKTVSDWEHLYFGDEFSSSMYIDAVNETFAPTSRSMDRAKWSDYNENILEYFNQNKNEY